MRVRGLKKKKKDKMNWRGDNSKDRVQNILEAAKQNDMTCES